MSDKQDSGENLVSDKRVGGDLGFALSIVSWLASVALSVVLSLLTISIAHELIRALNTESKPWAEREAMDGFEVLGYILFYALTFVPAYCFYFPMIKRLVFNVVNRIRANK